MQIFAITKVNETYALRSIKLSIHGELCLYNILYIFALNFKVSDGQMVFKFMCGENSTVSQ